MKAPRGLLAAGLAFWGWHAGLLAAALPMAVLLEGARSVSWRWDLDPKSAHRIADLCSVLLLGAMVFHLGTGQLPESLFLVLQWLPMVVFPLIAVQVYSAAGAIGLDALFVTLRNPHRPEPPPAVDLSYPFFALCLFAAAATRPEGAWLYAGLAALAGLALWRARPARSPAWLWGALLCVAAGAGFAAHHGLARLQAFVGEWVVAQFAELLDGDTDPFRSTTRIGAMGKIKTSGAIRFRVRGDGETEFPLRLQEATYGAFAAGTWFARDLTFTVLQPGADESSWTIAPPAAPERRVEVSGTMRGGLGLLPLPLGTHRVQHLPALGIERSDTGAVRMTDGPEFIAMEARFAVPPRGHAPPGPDDLQVPARLAPAFERVAAELELARQSPARRVQAVRGFFAERFRYSLASQERRRPGSRELEAFLTEHRSGHCEYFATATVLLLREAGIPARYAVGYAVMEWSRLEQAWVVRKRHAHAWALAYLDGAWREVDTTPPAWLEAEAESESLLQPVYDFFSWIAHQVSRWRWQGDEERDNAILLWLLIPLGGWLAWRLRGLRRVRRESAPRTAAAAPAQGSDSPFFRVAAHLEARGLGRRRSETARAWIARLAAEQPEVARIGELEPMVELHYRRRFDPRGLPEGEARRLELLVERWLAAARVASSAASRPAGEAG